MSFQPTTQPGSVVGSPGSTARGRRSPVLLVIGVVLVVVGVAGGLLLIAKASSSVEDGAKDLARAPGGCTTSLRFDKTGEFVVFYESKGKVSDLGGNCDGNGASFDRGDDQAPPQTLTMVGPDNKDVTLEDATGTTYDSGGFKGKEISKVRIDDAGLYKLTVAPDNADDAGYAIAIGKDPTADQGSLKAAGLGAVIAGVVLGGLLIILGLRRRGGGSPALVTAVPAASWNPGGPGPTWQPQPQPAWQPERPPPWPAQPQQPPVGPPSFGSPPSYGPPPAVPAPLPPTEQQRPASPFSPPRPPDA